jgi:hypothetical protein
MESLIGNTRRPDVTFYQNGRIDITSYVSRTLGVQAGDVIDIGHSQGEYYLYVRFHRDNCLGRHEGMCASSKQGSHNLRLYSKRICDVIFAVCKAQEKVQLAIGSPIEIEDVGIAVPLITRHNLYDKRS